ncbi:MAG: hypothetical protein KA297_06060 [Kofleriaceae bacterium]|nr:hypothetical protein [Kofleriaceae bacterium]MBP6836568.1 hypothetical protein [Kofleriaceae bacterium]
MTAATSPRRGRARTVALVVTFVAPSALFVLLTAAVYGGYRVDVPARADEATRTAAMAVLRAVVEAAPAPAEAAALARPLPSGGPLVVSAYLDGRELARASGRGATWAAALADTARALGAVPGFARIGAAERARLRLKLDAVVGRGRLGAGHWVFDLLAFPGLAETLALNPGLEGIGVAVAGREYFLLPEDLAARDLLASRRPSKAVPDLTMGVDLIRAEQLLMLQAKIYDRAAWRAAAPRYFRFRTDSFVERPVADRGQGGPLPLTRGIPPRPPMTAASLREAALEGGRYLVAHLAPTGRYVYEHDLATGRSTDPRVGGAYSIPRHAGTTYFLAELYRITRAEFLREPIERAFAHLQELVAAGGCTGTLPDGTAFACVVDRGQTEAHLGSTALTVVALAEYQRATGDTRYQATAEAMAAWILWMQRPDGSFRHRYLVKTQVANDQIQDLYYSGEAALALARMHVVTGAPRYADATRRALDWLVGWYDFFLGGFFYGEEHWTCIAAEAAFPAVKRGKYRDFCDGYGAFLRSQQPEAGELPDQDDLAGSYNVTPFVMPYNTPAGSRTEAMISAYLLGRHHGAGDPAILGQIEAALGYVLAQQIRPDSAYAAVGPLPVLGAVPESPTKRLVRIDYVQHVCSAMIRASEVLGRASPP